MHNINILRQQKMEDDMEIKIDKNVPVPVRKKGQLSGLSSVLKKMDIGDSFFIESNSANGITTLAKVVGVRVITKKEGVGRRIWRVG